MSDSVGRLANPLGPGIGVPGGPAMDVPERRLPGALGTPGGGGTPGVGAGPGNPLAPQGPLAAPGPGGMGAPLGQPPAMQGQMPSSPEAAVNILEKTHGQAKAAFQQTTKALGQLDAVRQGLEKLSDKGDVVTPEDVIEEAGKLVGHGIDPSALAGLLADMPQEGGGEALGGWVVTHAMTAAAAEQQLLVMHNVAQHQMGVSAMHLLMAHSTGHMIRTLDQGTEAGMTNELAPQQPPPGEGDTSMASVHRIGRRFMGPQ